MVCNNPIKDKNHGLNSDEEPLWFYDFQLNLEYLDMFEDIKMENLRRQRLKNSKDSHT